MSRNAVIVVPSQGNDAKQFFWCAHALKMQVYSSHAIIVKTEVTLPKGYDPLSQRFDAFEVRLATERHRPFSLNKQRNVSAFIMISHAAPTDGPNLTFGAGGYQPWSVYERHGLDKNPYGSKNFGIDMLRPRARLFWHAVGACLGQKGKIILLGCNYALGSYLEHVANESGHDTYGPASKVSAADVKTVLGMVKDIEHGALVDPMRKFEPYRRPKANEARNGPAPGQ